MAKKWRNVVLKIAQKLEMIFKIEKGASKKQMRLYYVIGETTVQDILKQKDKLLVFASVSGTPSWMKKQKSIKKLAYNELDSVLAIWLAKIWSKDI